MLSILLPEIWDTVFCFLSGILTIYLDVILLLVFCVSSSQCCGIAFAVCDFDIFLHSTCTFLLSRGTKLHISSTLK